jgi:tRNA G18 (ribose-2'-O)-methylase SpoU
VFQVPWTRATDLDGALEALRVADFEIAALALSDDAVTLDTYAAARPEKVALAFGTEGHGLSSTVLDGADTVVTIPMHGGVDSLNVASTVAVALWALGTDGR